MIIVVMIREDELRFGHVEDEYDKIVMEVMHGIHSKKQRWYRYTG